MKIFGMPLPANRLDQSAAGEHDQVIERIPVGEPHGQRVTGPIGLPAQRDAVEVDIDDAPDVAECGADVAHVLIEARRFLAPRNVARFRRDDDEAELLGEREERTLVVAPS